MMRAAIIAILVSGWAAVADAYPQFQLSTGNVRCNQCHYAPAGGGLINGYGRSEAADTISSGGDGRFLHGLWDPPSWLALGGDVRVAALGHNEDAVGGVDWEAFPMQADLYLRVGTNHISAYVNVGYRGSERADASFGSRFFSREHYLMWREGPTGWYVRAGRFFAPYGLRLAEHTTFVRRFLNLNTLEETYNLSGGYVSDEWELHLTAFTPDFWRDEVGRRGSGGAAYFERREGSKIAWGAQAKVSVGDADTQAMGGLVGKIFFDGPRLQLLAEADLVYQTFKDVDSHRGQLVSYLGVAWLPIRGSLIQLMLERYDEDLAIKGVARDSVSLELQWFPIAHVELVIFGQLQFIGLGSSDGTPSQLIMTQIHYYL